jgi:hypothetical protein
MQRGGGGIVRRARELGAGIGCYRGEVYRAAEQMRDLLAY